jgi:hypothetical protein
MTDPNDRDRIDRANVLLASASTAASGPTRAYYLAHARTLLLAAGEAHGRAMAALERMEADAAEGGRR